MADGEWIEAVWLDPPSQQGVERHAEVASALEQWLAAYGLSQADLATDDIRIDVVYIGPTAGACATRVRVRSSALAVG